jgi:hypothetical protein
MHSDAAVAGDVTFKVGLPPIPQIPALLPHSTQADVLPEPISNK